MARGLTDNQEGFVQSLLKGVTQRQAYKDNYKAENYTDKSIDEKASKLFSAVKVRARYDLLHDRIIKEAEEESIIEVKDVLKQIKDLLDTDITDIAEIRTEEHVVRNPANGDPLIKEDGTVATEWVQGIKMKDTDDMSQAALRSISEIGYNAYGLYIKRYDKQKTIDQAGKHLKMFTDKVETINKTVSIEVDSVEEADRIIKAFEKKKGGK